MNDWLFTGKVFHQRFSPREHKFSNRIFFIRFPLSRLAQLSNSIFSVNRWNILSFYSKDHGLRDGSNLWAWAVKQLHAAGIEAVVTEIEMQTFPRVLGYVFNPVSFWFCYSGNEHIATIAEVNNTFGESHCYVVPQGQNLQQKVLHVSPFFKIVGEYQFTFKITREDSIAGINYTKDNDRLLVANISGQAQAWTAKNLLKVWLTHPLMTVGVVFFIHWHALILYLKGIPFFGKNGVEEVL